MFSTINSERVPMIIPTVTNVNRPNTILMAGAAMSPRFFFSISDQKKFKSFGRDLVTVLQKEKRKREEL